ncbi:MAG: hypothetical protein RLZZ623_161 [Actinomycetota bacterium]
MPGRPAEQQLGTILVLLAAALFGTTGTVLTFAPSTATALGVGAVRLAIGGPFLLAVALTGDAFIVDLRPRWRSTLGGGVGAAAFQLLYFVSTTRTGVAVGTVVTIGSGPVFSGIIHGAVARRRPSAAWSIGTGLGVIGIALLVLSGDAGTVEPVGVVAALGAGLGWATFATLSKGQIDRGIDSSLSLGAIFTAAAILVSPLLLVEPIDWLGTRRGLVVAMYLGVFTLTLAYAMYGRALKRLPAPTVITLTLLEPVTAALLAVLLLDEHVAWVGWVGIAVVLLGLYITSRSSTVTTSPSGAQSAQLR